MNLLFKIFILLFLSQGKATVQTQGDIICWEQVLLHCDAQLNIQGDPQIVNEVINICSLEDIACEVSHGDDNKVRVLFRNMELKRQQRIMQQIKQQFPLVTIDFLQL